ncbi:MAG: hypothetical protein P8N63_01785 [Pseudomonadales bacterium]|nr:hypothetical protein [Pseudomonadales bacterium]
MTRYPILGFILLTLALPLSAEDAPLRLSRSDYADRLRGFWLSVLRELWHQHYALGFGLWALGFGLWALGFGLWGLGSRCHQPLQSPLKKNLNR